MNVVCEKCGTFLQKQKEYSELDKGEHEFSRICNYEPEYIKEHKEFLQYKMEEYIEQLLGGHKRINEIEDRHAKQITRESKKNKLFWDGLVKDVVEDYQKWKIENASTNL